MGALYVSCKLAEWDSRLYCISRHFMSFSPWMCLQFDNLSCLVLPDLLTLLPLGKKKETSLSASLPLFPEMIPLSERDLFGFLCRMFGSAPFHLLLAAQEFHLVSRQFERCGGLAVLVDVR